MTVFSSACTSTFVLTAIIATAAFGHYLHETFDDGDAWEGRWVRSSAKKNDVSSDIAKYDGVWELDESESRLVVTEPFKHYGLSRKLETPISFINWDKPLIIQYEVKYTNVLKCGGAYIKLLSASDGLDLTELTDQTPYTILFGPDKCGADKHLRFIYRMKNPMIDEYREVHATSIRKTKPVFESKKTILVTLVLLPDNKFVMKVNNKVVKSGNLTSSADFDPPLMPRETIDDPEDVKPSDWDDKEMMVDPDDKKPDDWDEDAPRTIPDKSAVKPEEWDETAPEYVPNPEAVKPEDWDDEEDGEWEPPLVPNPACDTGCGPWFPPEIRNPAYKGKWKPKMIKNPNYMGVWKPRQLKNPEHFKEDDPFHKLDPISAIAFELWTTTPGISFSNILITSSETEATEAVNVWREKRKTDEAALGEGGWRHQLQQFVDEILEKPYVLVAVTAILAGIITVFCMCCRSSEPVPSSPQSSPSEEDNGQSGPLENSANLSEESSGKVASSPSSRSQNENDNNDCEGESDVNNNTDSSDQSGTTHLRKRATT